MTYILLIALLLVGLAAFVLLQRVKALGGEDLSPYDSTPAPFASAEPSEGLTKLNALIHQLFAGPAQSAMAKTGWDDKRERFDGLALARDFGDAEFRADTLTVNGQEITGSWTLIPGYDANRRLLYMHGGAFTVGSDISHRPLTVQLARRTGMAVFTPNYRLMPENTRRDGIIDARAAYNWVLENGPDGPAPTSKLALAGDSAGGNLVLMLANWARQAHSQRPDAVVAFSPTTDATLSSPSMKSNIETDHMLGPLLGPALKAPQLLLLPAMTKHYGMSPSDPDQSPIYDDLSNLPPILIQVSQDELLRDDGIRFANKASAAKSPVSLQVWAGGLPHVWQIFDDYLSEAEAALSEVEVFLAKYV